MKIYYGNNGDENDKPSNNYLEVNACGISNYEFGDYTTIREKGRSDYQLIYIKKGKIDAYIIDKNVKLKAGHIIIYHPHEIQQYTYLEKDKYESVWFHFSGIGVEKILKELDLFDNRVFKVGISDEVDFLLSKLLPEHRLMRNGYKISECALVLQILCHIARYSKKSEPEHTSTKKKIEDILIKMESNITNNHTLKDYADEIHLSPGRFSHLFADTVGMSPHQYILKLKIDKAKQLFRQTDLSVGEVAEFTGFDDPLYFSRIFKKHCDMTPMQYKTRNSGKK